MNRLVVSLILVCSFLLAGVAHAAGYMTLEDSIRMAIEKNPDVKVQDQEVMGKDMEKRARFSRMLPTVDLSYGYMRLSDSPSLAVPGLGEVTTGSRGNSETDIEARQVLFAGGALYNSYKIAKNDYFGAELERQRVIRNLKLRVIGAYYGVIKARQEREVAKSNVNSIRSHLDVANAFFSQGMIPKNDLLEAQVSSAESEQNLISAEKNVRLAESNLNILLGRDLSEEVVIDTEIPFTALDITLDTALETALTNRQEIQTVKLQLDNADKGITIARSAFMPNVAATYAYQKQKGDDPSTKYDTWKTGIGLTWNLFEGGGSYWNLNKAQYMSAQVGYQLESLKDQVSLEVKDSYLSVEEARSRMVVADKAIAQAEEYFRIVKDRYNLQVATTSDVLTAQTLLSRSKKNIISAQADYARSLAALRASMGTL